MDTKRILNSDLLLPIEIRLEGLKERLTHLDQLLAEIPGALSEDMKESLERATLFRGMNAIQRSYEGIVTTLCLILDGSVPDDEEYWYKNALDQLAGSGSGRAPVLPSDLVALLQQVMVDPDFDPLLERKENLKVQRQRREAAQMAVPMLVDALGALDTLLADGTLRAGCLPDLPLDQAGRVRRFLDRVKDLSSMVPTQEELDRAPILHRWCAARLASSPFLLGHVEGHPILRSGARAHTSVLFQVAPDLGWARTWNRYYTLADHTPETLFAFQADGKVPPAVELIWFDDRLH